MAKESNDSVGQIGLDLVVNKNDFEKQMTGIQSLAKKAGAALAGAFAIKKLVDFGKSCIELGSDLSEVQNVVDVTFPHMSVCPECSKAVWFIRNDDKTHCRYFWSNGKSIWLRGKGSL